MPVVIYNGEQRLLTSLSEEEIYDMIEHQELELYSFKEWLYYRSNNDD
jgi:hypothetical protein